MLDILRERTKLLKQLIQYMYYINLTGRKRGDPLLLQREKRERREREKSSILGQWALLGSGSSVVCLFFHKIAVRDRDTPPSF